MGWKLNNSTLGQRDCGIEIQQIQDWDSEIFWMETQQFHLGTVRFLGCKLNNFRFGQWDFFFFFYKCSCAQIHLKGCSQGCGGFHGMDFVLLWSSTGAALSGQQPKSDFCRWFLAAALHSTGWNLCIWANFDNIPELIWNAFLVIAGETEKKKKNRRRKKQHWRELSHKSVWYEPGDLKNQSWQLFY